MDSTEYRWRKAGYSNSQGDCVEIGWRKASYSNGQGACVEVGWRKASYSNHQGSCVEVGRMAAEVVVRDTKQHGRGTVLAFSGEAWDSFVSAMKARD